MAILEPDFISEYYRSLIEISDLTKTTLQRENLINSYLHMISNQMGLRGIHLSISPSQSSFQAYRNFILGIDLRSSEYYQNNLVPQQKEALYTTYDVHTFGLQLADRSEVPVPDRGVKQVILIQHTGIVHVNLFMYSPLAIELDLQILTLLKDGVKLVCNVYSSLQSFDNLKESKQLDSGIFDYNIVPMFLLDDTFQVTRVNSEAQLLFSRITQLRTENLLKFILDPEIYEEMYTQLMRLPIDGVMTITRQDLSSFNFADTPDHMADLIFKRVEIAGKIYFVLNIDLLNESETNRIRQDLFSSRQSLVKELENYAKLYRKDRDNAIEYGLNNFFPSAFAFTINELSGPLILNTSPEIDRDILFEETIKLVSGLNTNQIMSQGYVIGTSPWSNPAGEFRWIAFYIENSKARGDVEIHVLGIVTKDNLMMMKSEMTNPLLGVLLSSMNQYTELIKEDQADFVTQSFNFDMYFSTVSLIGQILQEIRASSSELLAAYSSG